MRACALALALAAAGPLGAQVQIPEPLQPWVPWVMEDHPEWTAPPRYDKPKARLPIWPSRLLLEVDAHGARFTLDVEVFAEAMVALPGGEGAWPEEVRVGARLIPVLEREGRPAIFLTPGRMRVEGRIAWRERPARLPLPPTIGLLDLKLDGKAVALPPWDANGWLWLDQRPSSSPAEEKDFLATELYGVLEDGIPMWMHIEIELSVAGRNREETIGRVIPKGWKLAAVEAPIPVAVEDDGSMKAQVRPGKWKVRLSAFQLEDARVIEFGPAPASPTLLLGLRQQPDFRVVELEGVQQLDVSQTTFPERWRELPVFRWSLESPLQVIEKLRGLGGRAPPGLSISRRWWLDADGKACTVQDTIRGENQTLWRLDVSPGLELGSVRMGSEMQLITRNPQSGAAGFEVRRRSFDIAAVGRMAMQGGIPASGWQAPAESVEIHLQLPPGWRLFGVSGADWVRGSWLNHWTLLDLFVLLIITLAVHRLCGWAIATIAFLGLALSFHEPGAPRYLWLAALVPIALLQALKKGRGREVVVWLKWAAISLLGLALVPFSAAQLEQALYPQLEKLPAQPPQFFAAESQIQPEPEDSTFAAYPMPSGAMAAPMERKSKAEPRTSQNLSQDASAKIQTGPAVPEWSWRLVSFGWDGPVEARQMVRPWLVPAWLERILSVLRVGLLIALAFRLARMSGLSARPSGSTAAVAAVLVAGCALCAPSTSRAEFPTPELLEELKGRLLQAPMVFPGAAEISMASLEVEDRSVHITAVLQVAARCAVPVPANLENWSPVSIQMDGQPQPALRREDGSLWILAEPGVHTLRLSGVLPETNEWEWSFLLRPRQVRVVAPGWQVLGIRPNGTPEARVFLRREAAEEVKAGSGGFARQNLVPIARVERSIELGLRWEIQTCVRRLSPAGNSFSLRVPLLPGEKVLSAGVSVSQGSVNVNFGPGQETFSWSSEMKPASTLELRTRASDPWGEVWNLQVSPIWNVAFAGLPPTFDLQSQELKPVWRPWPGESATLSISRPEAIPGPTTTVHRLSHEVSLGNRQTSSLLQMAVQASLGMDFPIALPEDAEVTALRRGKEELPVRVSQGALVVPLVPGEQMLTVEWRQPATPSGKRQVPAVRLPIESSNLSMTLRMPQNQWVMWTAGPVRGPAVRFWAILALTITAAWVLARTRSTPLRFGGWVVLGLGLTQVHFLASALVVAWFLVFALKTRTGWQQLSPWAYNLGQIVLLGLTVSAIAVLLSVLAAGLLGDPKMFIAGNGSTAGELRWFQESSGGELPRPTAWVLSIWWYRLAMLAWALWLAFSVIRWAGWAWQQFSSGGVFRGRQGLAKPLSTPPPLS